MIFGQIGISGIILHQRNIRKRVHSAAGQSGSQLCAHIGRSNLHNVEINIRIILLIVFRSQFNCRYIQRRIPAPNRKSLAIASRLCRGLGTACAPALEGPSEEAPPGVLGWQPLNTDAAIAAAKRLANTFFHFHFLSFILTYFCECFQNHSGNKGAIRFHKVDLNLAGIKISAFTG